MKTILFSIALAVTSVCPSFAADVTTFTNEIWQVQLPSGVTYKMPITQTGARASELEINPNGARFELWTTKSSPYTEYLLDTRYVGSYVPIAQVVIDTEDNYGKDLERSGTVPVNLPAMIRRTRADRPFTVHVNVTGLRNGPQDPAASKSINFMRHVQSYGPGGTGVNLDRTQATLLTQSSIGTNGSQALVYSLNSVPGSDRSKVRGEERFSAYSLRDVQGNTYDVPASQLASQFIQVWPVSDSTISGISAGQVIRFALPTVTITMNDLYPDSRTYAQVYRGSPVLGTVGTVVPGSNQIINDSTPQSRVLTLSNYDNILSGDGRWTMEVLTVTPFGIDRLTYLTFDLDRTLELNGNVSTLSQ